LQFAQRVAQVLSKEKMISGSKKLPYVAPTIEPEPLAIT
jgi:hypothetical protein